MSGAGREERETNRLIARLSKGGAEDVNSLIKDLIGERGKGLWLK